MLEGSIFKFNDILGKTLTLQMHILRLCLQAQGHELFLPLHPSLQGGTRKQTHDHLDLRLSHHMFLHRLPFLMRQSSADDHLRLSDQLNSGLCPPVQSKCSNLDTESDLRSSSKIKRDGNHPRSCM